MNKSVSFIVRYLLVAMVLLAENINSASAELPKYSFSSITNNSGLSHNTVYDICQDDKGFMWFATDGGLNRYDGQNIKQYFPDGSERSLPANSVECVLYTIHNQLFVGTFNGLALYHPDTDDFERIYYNEKSLGEILSLQQGIGSEILIATANQGAFMYNYEKKYFRSLDFLRERVYGVSVDKNGDFWAFSRFRIFRFDKNYKITSEYVVSPQLFNSAISYMGTDSKGVLWVGTFEKGLYTFDFERGIFQPFVSSNGVEMYYIRTLEESENKDEYWIGTEKGLYIMNVKTGFFQHYVQSFDENRKTINDNAVYKIFRNSQNVFFCRNLFWWCKCGQNASYWLRSHLSRRQTGIFAGKSTECYGQSARWKSVDCHRRCRNCDLQPLNR